MSDKRRAVKRRLNDAGESESDPWPDEPDEFDPDSLTPDTPIAGDSGAADTETDIDGELLRGFYAAVVLANVGLFGLSLGAMVAYFRGQLLLGGVAMLVGTSALFRTYQLVDKHGGSE
ncbi:hypothetical protein BRD20_00715 [Halobacteriales archaeon SW_8_65_20]|nr:MAG: hypothetical protein BRD20_00715 [Halobacteriales archaeon SW_8_65_20]